jgi:hypothetical protein
MAYYDALIAKWATLSGTTASKLQQINALTVTLSGAPEKALLTPSQILNAIVPADLASLTTAQVALLTLLLQGSTVDASQGSTIRAAALAIFTGKTTTLQNLAALVDGFDKPAIPWWQATVAQGGGELRGPVAPSDLKQAGDLT